jgi:hypothetical protein
MNWNSNEVNWNLLIGIIGIIILVPIEKLQHGIYFGIVYSIFMPYMNEAHSKIQYVLVTRQIKDLPWHNVGAEMSALIMSAS